MTDHALLSVTRISAQGPSDVVNQTSLWLQEVQAIAAVATTVGVLIALYVATIREPKKAAEESRRHKAQMDALRRAHRKRVAAQARKVIPSCVRTPMFGGSWWTVTIDNASNAMTTILSVEVEAIDTNGLEVPGGCRPADRTVPFDQAFDRAVRAAQSVSLRDGSDQPGDRRQLGSDPVPVLKQAVRDTLAGHFVKQWPRTLSPNQYAVMAYTTTDPNYICGSQSTTRTKTAINGAAPIPANQHAQIKRSGPRRRDAGSRVATLLEVNIREIY